MQEDYTLVLNNFSSLFEIFCVYYLALGVSKFFNDYFDVSKWFKDWINNDFINSNKLTEIEKDIQTRSLNLGSETVQKISTARNLVSVIFHSCKHYFKLRANRKKARLRKTLITKVQKLILFVDFHYPQKDEVNNSEIVSKFLIGFKDVEIKKPNYFQLIRPIYLYFGILSLGLLFLSGYYSERDKAQTLAILNTISISVTLFFIFQLLVSHFNKIPFIQISPIKAFLSTLLILIIVLPLPNRYIEKISIFPFFISESFLSFSDFQIILSLVLLVSPLLIHIISLVSLIALLKNVRKIYRQTITLLIEPTIINANEITKLK